MTSGNLELVQVVTSWVFTVPVVAGVVVLDEKRLRGDALERSWPSVSRDVTIFGSWLVGTLYGSAGLFVHFAATRRSFRGALLGVGWAAALLAINVAGELGVAYLVDALGL